ncbi:MAG TPA: hypothetical protein VF646_14550 [Cytophagales bacterium]|jgi:hypothetical protein
MKFLFHHAKRVNARMSVWIVLLAALLGACRTADPRPDPEENPGGEPPPTGQVQRLRRITWAPTDYQEYAYNADGLLAQYTAQWLFVAGTDQVKRLETVFAYDSQRRLVSTTTNGGPPVRYFYRGNTLHRTEEYDRQGKLYLTHYYAFEGGQRLSQRRDVYAYGNEVRTTYHYGPGNNLAVEKIYQENDSTGELEFAFSIHYEGFDDKKNPEATTVLQPYLPGVALWANNYTLKTLRGKRGEPLQPARQYAFTYNEAGYPLQKTVKSLEGEAAPVLLATYAYEDRP